MVVAFGDALRSRAGSDDTRVRRGPVATQAAQVLQFPAMVCPAAAPSSNAGPDLSTGTNTW
jgi:hypothetical protein